MALRQTDEHKLKLLSSELTKPQPNEKTIQKLAKALKIRYSEDPFELTNEVLKRLHKAEEKNKTP